MRRGHFTDAWRGDGWFASFWIRGGWLLFAFRPACWRLRIVRPPAKPRVIRLYFGPFEIERRMLSAAPAAPQPQKEQPE